MNRRTLMALGLTCGATVLPAGACCASSRDRVRFKLGIAVEQDSWLTALDQLLYDTVSLASVGQGGEIDQPDANAVGMLDGLGSPTHQTAIGRQGFADHPWWPQRNRSISINSVVHETIFTKTLSFLNAGAHR